MLSRRFGSISRPLRARFHLSSIQRSSKSPKFGIQRANGLTLTAMTFGAFGVALYYTMPDAKFYPTVGNSGTGSLSPPVGAKSFELTTKVSSATEKSEGTSSKPSDINEKKHESEDEELTSIGSNASQEPDSPVTEPPHPEIVASEEDLEKGVVPDPAVDTKTSADISHPAGAKTAVELMKAQFVLVGGGTATYSAMGAIQKAMPKADILIITDEQYPPYMRPPLSKELWFEDSPSLLRFRDWGGKDRSIVYDPLESYQLEPFSDNSGGKSESDTAKDTLNKSVRLIVGHKVVAMDAEAQTLSLDDGRKVKYGKVLLATGGRPKQLDVFQKAGLNDKVSTFRGIDDLKRIESVLKEGEKQLVVVGGGFLGSELACSTAYFGRKYKTSVTQVFPEQGNMALVFPEYLTKWTTDKVSKEGVNVLKGRKVEQASRDGDKVILSLSDGTSITADHVIVATGIEPNVELAKSAGLEIDETRGGIMVNAELEARKNVFVAGDLTSFHDITLGRRRIEHHDHAVLSGRWAGKNMSGAQKPYKHQSIFWSDLGPEIGYEAVGILDSKLPTVGIWVKASENDTPRAAIQADSNNIRTAAIDKLPESNEQVSANESESITKENDSAKKPTEKEDYGKGVVFYLKDEKIVGVLLWNVFRRTSLAQHIIQEQRTVGDIRDLARQFGIHED